MKNSVTFLALSLFCIFSFQTIHAQVGISEKPLLREGQAQFRTIHQKGPTKAGMIQFSAITYKIYPNPAQDLLIVEGPKYECKAKGCYSISIMNKQGIKLTKLDNVSFNDHPAEVDLRDFATGHYYINIFLEDRHVYESRFIVEK